MSEKPIHFPPLVWPWPTINDIRTQASQALLDAPPERARSGYERAKIESDDDQALL